MTDNRNLQFIFKLWLITFSIIPFAIILIISFFDGNSHLTLNNYIAVFNPLYLKLIATSIINATIITFVCLLVVVPLTYLITLQKRRKLLLVLFLIPTWVNLLLKIYAFIGLLASDGIINQTLNAVGLNQVDFLFNIKGFLIVTIYIYMPFMMLPLYNSMVKIPQNLIKAARDLGASEFKIFISIVIPLSKKAIASGISLVFIPALSIFMITRLITGNKVMTLGAAIEQQFLVTGDWNMGSCLAISLIVIMICFNFGFQMLTKFKVIRRDDDQK